MHTVNLSGVGEPFPGFLTQDTRYHCPAYCVFKFKKSLIKPFTRKIWLYEKGNYKELRQSVNDYDWKCSYNDNINLYANNFTTKLMELTEKCIPSKTVTVRQLGLPWTNSNIRRKMRKRNRLFSVNIRKTKVL